MEIKREEFVEWLAGQPAEKGFDFMDCGDCAIAQFLKDKTEKEWLVGGSTYHKPYDREHHAIPTWLVEANSVNTRRNGTEFTAGHLLNTIKEQAK